MSCQSHVMIVVGTRPEAIKMAPVAHQLAGDPERIRVSLLVTAQHREMLDQVLQHFGLQPDHDLNIMTPGQSLTQVVVRALEGLDRVLEREPPQLVLVHGDTATSVAAGLAAFHRQIKVGHVEAGLRSGDRRQPFPEEMYRRLTGVVADLHFAPTAGARSNLEGEGVSRSRIVVTGNTVIDALEMTVDPAYTWKMPQLGDLPSESKLILVEAHRRENWGRGLESICRALRDLVRSRPETYLLFSVHKNPQVSRVVMEYLGEEERVMLLPPLDYPEWINLMARSYLIITDSGGLQEEAPALGVPVLLLRDVTERPEALEAGTVRMVGTDRERILSWSQRLLDEPEEHARMAGAPNPFGDGQASRRIKEYLLYFWGWEKAPPEEFR